MEPVNVLEARNNLSKLIAAAEAGEDVVISRRGHPAVRLVPVDREEKKYFTGKTLAAYLEANHRFRGNRTSEQIDADIAAERDAWE
jgi:prevent-host-death family protein